MLIFDIQVINLQYSVQAWNCDATTSSNEGPEKTLYTDVVIAAHAIA